MKTRNILRILASTAVIATLSACGGGGPGGGGSDPVVAPIAPMKGMSTQDYQALQQRGVIAADGEATEFVSLASSYTSSAPFTEAVGRRSGTLTIASGRTEDGQVVRDPSMTFRTGQHDTGPVSFHPDYASSQGVSGDATGSINGEGIYLGRVDQDQQSTSVVYIPRGDSEMYVGGYASDIDGIRAFHGVFGRTTTSGEMSRLSGVARYSGVGMASVNRYDGSAAESGLYEGTSGAVVNFDTNSYTMDGEFSRDRAYSAGTDTITMTSTGTFDASGKMTGGASYGGITAGTATVSGDVDGHFFGPGAESVGATFIGTGDDGQGNYGHIVGSAVMNRD